MLLPLPTHSYPHRIYELYSDYVMKNPFYEVEQVGQSLHPADSVVHGRGSTCACACAAPCTHTAHMAADRCLAWPCTSDLPIQKVNPFLALTGHQV